MRHDSNSLSAVVSKESYLKETAFPKLLDRLWSSLDADIVGVRYSSEYSFCFLMQIENRVSKTGRRNRCSHSCETMALSDTCETHGDFSASHGSDSPCLKFHRFQLLAVSGLIPVSTVWRTPARIM